MLGLDAATRGAALPALPSLALSAKMFIALIMIYCENEEHRIVETPHDTERLVLDGGTIKW